ncbi:MAG: D-alanine--D-alanine ligase [Rhodothermales bacterium]
MRVGLVYDVFSSYSWKASDPRDADAEFEPDATVESLEKAIENLGHEPVRIGTANDLLAQLPQLNIDVAVNIAEGAHSRNREAYVPILLEMAGVPFLGSDALTLSLSLDKVWTKDLAHAAGVNTPAYAVYTAASVRGIKEPPAPFPLFVKPRYEGSSKGITHASKVESLSALKEQVVHTCAQYKQDALVESFISGGGEFTVAVIGNNPPEALPVLQRAVESVTEIGLHALDRRGYVHPDLGYKLDGELSEVLEDRLQADALKVFEKLECLDFARVDFRVDAAGEPWFLEINPLPTFAPDGTFAILAELVGQSYPEFLAATLDKGFKRLGLDGKSG